MEEVRHHAAGKGEYRPGCPGEQQRQPISTSKDVGVEFPFLKKISADSKIAQGMQKAYERQTDRENAGFMWREKSRQYDDGDEGDSCPTITVEELNEQRSANGHLLHSHRIGAMRVRLRMLPGDGAKRCFNLPHNRAPPEVLRVRSDPRRLEAVTGVAEDADTLRDAFRIGILDKKPGFPVPHGVDRSPASAAQDGNPAGVRLDIDDAEPFDIGRGRLGGENEQVGLPISHEDLRLVQTSRESHPVRDAE